MLFAKPVTLCIIEGVRSLAYRIGSLVGGSLIGYLTVSGIQDRGWVGYLEVGVGEDLSR
jgi:hypothetical protein